MRKRRLLISAAAAIAAACVLSGYDCSVLCAAAIAVLIHELGHLVAICVLGLHVKGFDFEISGLKIVYSGLSNWLKDFIIAVSGPLFGLAYYLSLSGTGMHVCNLSAKISALYSLFNLIPVLPLDGGRMMLSAAAAMLDEEESIKLTSKISLCLSMALSALGLGLMLFGEGSAMFAAGIWLLLLQK